MLFIHIFKAYYRFLISNLLDMAAVLAILLIR